jgi:cell division protein FtsQ
VAKIETIKTRASGLSPVSGLSHATRLGEVPADDFYRPAAVPKVRMGRGSSGLGSGPVARRVEAALALDSEDEDALEEEAFLRARRRVPVRRGLLPASGIQRLGVVFAVFSGLLIVATVIYACRYFLRHDSHFRIADSSSIQIAGNTEVTRAQLLSVFGDDVDSNIFSVPMKERRAELERLPWVEHATVMRLLPNQLRLSIVERVPVAFVRNGNEIGLVDRNGVLLTMPTEAMTAHHYSFPVVTGITSRDPLSTRAARMENYEKFIAELDSGGSKISDQLSEIDLSDPEDVKAILPEQGSDILAHFGEGKFLARYKNFKAHYAEWKQQYPKLAAVDLRYDQQVVLQMEKGSEVPASPNRADSAANDAATGSEDNAPVPVKPAPVAQKSHTHLKPQKKMSKAKPRFSFTPRPAGVHRGQQ